MKYIYCFLLLLFFSPARTAFGRWDHIVVVVLENVGYKPIISNKTGAPYINNTLLSQNALYTQSFGVTRPSLPNYLALFSGSTLGVTNDQCLNGSPPNGPFNPPNLYCKIKAAGFTVRGFFETLNETTPLACTTGSCATTGQYAQKHNPFAFFGVLGPNYVPVTAWTAYNPAQTSWPNLVFSVPNIPNDMHDCGSSTVPQQVKKGDSWLGNNLPAPLDLIYEIVTCPPQSSSSFTRKRQFAVQQINHANQIIELENQYL